MTQFSVSIPLYTIAVILFIWYLVVVGLAYNGFVEIFRKFNNSLRSKIDCKIIDSELEGVSILRPIKGVDPEMEICLQSSFQQDYALDKFEIIFCVQDSKDPAINLVERLIAKYPHVDAKLMIDDQANKANYGPNPKVNNLAKGYKAAKFDILWVQDSNVWSRPDVLRRSVYSLTHSLDNGRTTKRPVKLIHHAPMATCLTQNGELSSLGAQLDEMFLATSHSKFYVSLNKVAVAPCVNGKSNLYKRSELDDAVKKMGDLAEVASIDGQSGDRLQDAKYYSLTPGEGLRFFARYIGEDNMIGIALWDFGHGRTGMTGDCVMQPSSGYNSIFDYCVRRMRWLRVRKYMVLAATLLEPTTECILCGTFGTFAISVLFFNQFFSRAWFVFHVMIWFLTDFIQFHYLFSCVRMNNGSSDTSSTTTGNGSQPFFLNESFNMGFRFKGHRFRSLKKFVPIWILREILAFPVWLVAILGSRIDWRGQPFKIKADLSAERL
ncbi:glycosyltransferase family 21 protein [[Candida] arabinofermentans NRRL YB-2248]|uniref:Ceramide glucosyltransferase n=1 Tax=[Candida] arabinofermentans NRRL YB-2248 TaxID=983967 RepID=A0A1E4T2J4_9ASCO|nr:glycosyltransferase family 21 protein [[Candida] arabinofermentans NRRL YB-2248]